MDELNNIQLNKILKHDMCTSRYFLGVFSNDNLPKKIKNYPSIFIINTSPSYIQEGHWLAVFISKNKQLYFFDSYGLHPKFYKLNKYFNSISRKFTYNKTQFQSFFSKTCGYFCLIFILL